MSAFNFGGQQNGKNKSRSKYKYQIEKNEDGNEEQSRHSTRCDLKRTPLRESYKKSQIYLTLPNLATNQKKSSTFYVRDPKHSSNGLLEERKVIEHPFKTAQKFRKVSDFHQVISVSAAKKHDKNKIDGFESSLFSTVKVNSPYAVDSEQMCTSNADVPKFTPHARNLPVQVGPFLFKKKGRTNEDVLALHEKDQYKLLLEHFTKCSVRQPDEKEDSILKVKDAQGNICGKSPANSALEQQAFHKTLDPNATKFFAKYFKGHSYGISPASTSGNKPPGMRRSAICSSKGGGSEDDLIISEVRFPQPRSLPQDVPSSPFFSPQWLHELRKSFNEETVKKVKVIRDQEEKIKQFRESRAARFKAEDKALEQLRMPGSALSEADVEDTSIEFPELTPKMEEIIDDALNPEPPEEVLCVGFNISVSRKDIETLAGLNWLNDEIIFFYMNLLMERSKNENYPRVYAFNTFFYPKLLSGGHSALKRWTRKMDIFSYDLILVPVHMGMHWCLAVIDFRHKKIRYYDSMGGQNTDCLHALRDYLKDERMDKKKETYDMTGWVYENVKNIPHQMNGSDCGMFTLKYAEYITRDAKITFTQDHMQYFRRRMVYEILTKQLL